MGSHDYQFLLHSYPKAAVFQELLPVIETYCALQLRRAAIDRLKKTLLPEIGGATAVQVSLSFSHYLSESKTSLPSTNQQKTHLGKMRMFINLTSCILELITVD